MDQISLKRIETAHPKLRDELKKIYTEINTVLTGRGMCRIAYVLRTFEEQTKLFNQKPKVTNSKAGQSYHNYGLAVDIVFIIDGKEVSYDTAKDWDGDKVADWLEVVKIFNKYGWQWGFMKNGKRWDLPHFQKTFGLHWSELLKRYNAGKKDANGYVVI